MTNFFRECREFVGEGAGRGGSVARPRAASSGCAGHSAPAGACGSGAEAGQSERAAAAVLLLLSFFKLRNFSLKLVSQLIFVEFFFFFFTSFIYSAFRTALCCDRESTTAFRGLEGDGGGGHKRSVGGHTVKCGRLSECPRQINAGASNH